MDPNLPDKDGHTPFHLAVEKGRNPIIALFLNSPKVDPNEPNEFGETPLHRVVKAGRTSTLDLFLKNSRVDPNLRDNHGKTPLDLAVEGGDTSIATEIRAELARREALKKGQDPSPNTQACDKIAERLR